MVRRLPPIAEIAVGAMALIIVGGITLASRLPHPAPLPVLVALLAVAAVLVLVDVVLLARLRDFAWPLFFQVAKWSLLAYAVMYGILEFTFVYDHVTGSTLAVLTLMLAVFALDVPLLFGFSVARYADGSRHATDAPLSGQVLGTVATLDGGTVLLVDNRHRDGIVRRHTRWRLVAVIARRVDHGRRWRARRSRGQTAMPSNPLLLSYFSLACP